MEVSQHQANLIAALVSERGKYPKGFWFSRSQLTRRSNMSLEELCLCIDTFRERRWIREKPATKGVRKRAKFKLRFNRVKKAMHATEVRNG
jgi:hypothetical protein